MFDKSWVLSELRSGRDYEDIMDEISTVLNQASEEYEKEQKAKDLRLDKIEYMKDILSTIHDYCVEYYGKTNEDIDKIHDFFADDEGDAEVFVDLIDDIMQLANLSSSNLEEALSKLLTFLK